MVRRRNGSASPVPDGDRFRLHWVSNHTFRFLFLFLFLLSGLLTHQDMTSRAARSARREEVSDKERTSWAEADAARKALIEQERRSWEDAVWKAVAGRDRIDKQAADSARSHQLRRGCPRRSTTPCHGGMQMRGPTSGRALARVRQTSLRRLNRSSASRRKHLKQRPKCQRSGRTSRRRRRRTHRGPRACRRGRTPQ